MSLFPYGDIFPEHYQGVKFAEQSQEIIGFLDTSSFSHILELDKEQRGVFLRLRGELIKVLDPQT
jgi:hypothetical protein